MWADRVARSHPQIYLSTSTPTHLHIYITPAHPHCHSFTSTLSFFLSFFLYIFSTVLDNYMSRSRANRRRVFCTFCFLFCYLILDITCLFKAPNDSSGLSPGWWPHEQKVLGEGLARFVSQQEAYKLINARRGLPRLAKRYHSDAASFCR